MMRGDPPRHPRHTSSPHLRSFHHTTCVASPLSIMLGRCKNANLCSKCHVPLSFALWYALNVAYNITNKWALDGVHKFVAENTSQSSPLPFTIGCLQFGIGATYACTLWTLGWRRPVPHAEELWRAATILKNSFRKLCRKARNLTRLSSHSYAPMTSPIVAPLQTTKVYTPTNNSNSENNSPSSINISHTFRIAVLHTLGQLCTVISLSANSISFAHVIKAMEPLFSALASLLILGQRMDFRVYLSLIPVVGGVVMACAGSREFSWISFWAGMGSNAFFAMRAVISKIAMEGSSKGNVSASRNNTDSGMNNEEGNNCNDMDVEQNGDSAKEHHQTPTRLSPANLFAAVTCVSFFLSIPLALIFEGGILREITHITSKAGIEKEKQSDSHETLLLHIISSGLFHYLNNEVMYLVLSNVHPVTLAVGNTMKRVFIIVAGVLVFSTPMTFQTTLGSTIGIGGVFLYSMVKQWYGSTSGSDR